MPFAVGAHDVLDLFARDVRAVEQAGLHAVELVAVARVAVVEAALHDAGRGAVEQRVEGAAVRALEDALMHALGLVDDDEQGAVGVVFLVPALEAGSLVGDERVDGPAGGCAHEVVGAGDAAPAGEAREVGVDGGDDLLGELFAVLAGDDDLAAGVGGGPPQGGPGDDALALPRAVRRDEGDLRARRAGTAGVLQGGECAILPGVEGHLENALDEADGSRGQIVAGGVSLG